MADVLDKKLDPPPRLLEQLQRVYKINPLWVKDGPPHEIEITVEEDRTTLADVAREIESGMKRLLASGLNREAVVILLQAKTKVPKRQLEKVLDGLSTLAEDYTQ